MSLGAIWLAALALAAPASASAGPGAAVGESVRGAEIRAERIGPADAPVNVLVVGSIHGNETAGHAVVDELRVREPAPGVALHLVRTVNPDGARRGTRQNARGVDLNRNFPWRWRGGGRPFDVYHPGRRPASEPETRVAQRLIRRLDPDVTIWFHQHMRLVTLSPGADPAVVRAYGDRVGLPAKKLPRYRGTATSWQNRRDADSNAFVVELPAGRLSKDATGRHADAVLAAGTDVLGAQAAAAAAMDAERPEIDWDPIPFGPRRIAQMRAYARRHYGLNRARLLEPKVIVEHFTVTDTYPPVFNTFAANRRDPELRELPGVCAHFVIDRDGTIHQLVRLKWMCRHTVGLNHTSIGIEHVGRSDEEIMGNERQLDASLRLTRWLQQRHGIATEDVIGHAESLSSPHHRERVRRLRKQTHGDFVRETMDRYRGKL